MCREGAWAELTIQVTRGDLVRRRMHGMKKGMGTSDDFRCFFVVICIFVKNKVRITKRTAKMSEKFVISMLSKYDILFLDF